jgi:hypothetical protein
LQRFLFGIPVKISLRQADKGGYDHPGAQDDQEHRDPVMRMGDGIFTGYGDSAETKKHDDSHTDNDDITGRVGIIPGDDNFSKKRILIHSHCLACLDVGMISEQIKLSGPYIRSLS